MCVSQLNEQVCRNCAVCSVLKGAEAQIPVLTWHIFTLLEVLPIGILTLDMSEHRYYDILVMVVHSKKVWVAALTNAQTVNTTTQRV